MENRKLLTTQLGRMKPEEYPMARKHPVIVILDNVRSLHNIGSIFRTSDAFLLEAVYLCGICATPPHKEIHKSALGAENVVPWMYFEETIEAVLAVRKNKYEVIAIEQTENSQSLERFEVDIDKKYALVFGNEVRGIQQDVIDLCTSAVEIPQFGTKHSFNVSVSAGIVLWEWYRKFNGV
jgi:23S rRNA (guanosine2251-2'-O)-methyltransferase